MKVSIKIVVGILLLFNGIGAIYGGSSLILHPDGSGMQLSLHWLEHAPFKNYLIPGLVLFICNGLLSFYVLMIMVRNQIRYFFMIALQGAVLVGWIVVQILMMQTVYFLHIIMGVVGLMLLFLGVVLVGLNNQTANRVTSGGSGY